MNKRGIIMIKLDKIIKIYNPKKANEYEGFAWGIMRDIRR